MKRRNRVKYSRDLQESQDSNSVKTYASYAGGVGLIIFFLWFFIHSGSNLSDQHGKNTDKKVDVASERLVMADGLGKLIDANPSICVDRPHLLNFEDTTCENRIEMLQAMNVYCEKDENTLLACCATCEKNHMLRKNDDESKACVDRENLLTDGGSCSDLMRTLFYVGMDCKTTEEAQKSCCLSCSKSEYFDDSCKDFNEFMTHGDCSSAFKEYSQQKRTCDGNDEVSKFCCSTCHRLDSLYGQNACWDLDYKLPFGNCQERTLLLQKLDKPCDDDPKVAKECCQSCSPHRMEKGGCWDSLYLIDGKQCSEHAAELQKKGQKCSAELKDQCCRSCEFDRCDDTMSLIRGNECAYHVMMLNLSKMTCKDDKEVKEKCCKSCTEKFGKK